MVSEPIFFQFFNDFDVFRGACLLYNKKITGDGITERFRFFTVHLLIINRTKNNKITNLGPTG